MKHILELKKNSPALADLSSFDPKLGVLINLVGEYSLPLRTDYFASLVRAIIGQQLSVKVAATIWNRTCQLCNSVKPDVILSLSADELRNIGLSKSKIIYIKDLSEKVLANEINLAEFNSLDDSEVINTLTKVKGIGRWTAEMFLIFSLGRPDILSADDLGLRRAVKWLYTLPELPTPKEMQNYGESLKPHRTAASLYLWEAINRGYVNEHPLPLEIKVERV